MLLSHPIAASRQLTLAIFSAVLFLAVATYPLLWLLTTTNPEVNTPLALLVNLLFSTIATALGTIGYATALWRSSRIAHSVRHRLYLISAATALAWCLRHLPTLRLSNTNTVRLLLACALVLACILGLSLLKVALRKQWLYPPRTPGLCRHCRYNLTGNTTGTCPECGTPTRQSLP